MSAVHIPSCGVISGAWHSQRHLSTPCSCPVMGVGVFSKKKWVSLSHFEAPHSTCLGIELSGLMTFLEPRYFLWDWHHWILLKEVRLRAVALTSAGIDPLPLQKSLQETSVTGNQPYETFSVINQPESCRIVSESFHSFFFFLLPHFHGICGAGEEDVKGNAYPWV